VEWKTDESTFDGWRRTPDLMISRRQAVTASSLAVLGLLSPSAFGEAGEKSPAPPNLPKEILERMEKSKAFSERMQNAGSNAGRLQVMSEQMAQQQQMVFESLRTQLQISDEEWPVVRPRLQAVYDLVRPVPVFGPRNAQPATPVEQRSRELREVLGNKDAKAEEIKPRLTALRAAKEQARQELVRARESLRQIMTVRQEAVLVLNGLLE